MDSAKLGCNGHESTHPCTGIVDCLSWLVVELTETGLDADNSLCALLIILLVNVFEGLHNNCIFPPQSLRESLRQGMERGGRSKLRCIRDARDQDLHVLYCGTRRLRFVMEVRVIDQSPPLMEPGGRNDSVWSCSWN